MSAPGHHTVGLRAPFLGQEGLEGRQVVRTGRALPSAFGRRRRNEWRGGRVSPALPPLTCAHHRGVADEGSIHEEPPEEFGLLSQLLFIFCALKSLEI